MNNNPFAAAGYTPRGNTANIKSDLYKTKKFDIQQYIKQRKIDEDQKEFG